MALAGLSSGIFMIFFGENFVVFNKKTLDNSANKDDDLSVIK